MPSATLKRPGIAFETRTPALGEALPRLDIAAFVGFAASGPIGLPVPIEDAPRFHELFGTDVPLAWDDVRCDWEYGELAPSVRAFFRGGGQRCWIVRAANAAQAASNCFPIPGVLAAGPEEVPGAAAALARSPGSWSDTLLVNATLSLRPLAPPPAGASAVSGVRAGDMVRLQYDDPGITGFVAATLPPGGSTVQPVDAGTWFQRVTPDTLPPPGAPMGDVAWLEPPVRVRALTGAAAAGPGALVDPLIDIAGWGWRGEQLLVELTSDGPSILRPGSWLQLSLTGAGAPRRPEVYLLVEQVEHEETLSPPGGVLARLVSQSAWWLLDAAAVVPSLPTPAPQRATLELELWVRSGDTPVTRLAGIGCAPGHAAFWGDAPDDRALFALDASGTPVDAGRSVAELGMHALVDHPRFPLAALPGGAYLLPLAALAWPREEMYQPALPRAEPAGVRDGLAAFDASLFLDPDLADERTATLLTEATRIQYVDPPRDGSSRAGRPLAGLHALVPIEEIGMVAVPDAVQRGWHGWRAGAGDLPGLDAPQLTDVSPDPGGAGIQLRWEPVAGAADYEAEASTDPRFAAPGALWTLDAPVQANEEGTLTLLDSAAALALRLPTTPGVPCAPRPCDGTTYYYRVRALDAAGLPGPWSNTRAQSPTPQLFFPAALPPLGAPAPVTLAQERGRFILDWGAPDGAPPGAWVSFTLESARDPAFDSAEVVYRGTEPHFELWRATGARTWFRVTADVDARPTPWSVTVSAGQVDATAVLVDAVADFDPTTLEAVHVALMRLCAARGDCHAVLGLPLHYRDEAARAHAARLVTRIQAEDGSPRPLSFGAVFHPWPVVRETTGSAPESIWAVAPDGAICAILADRTLRGAAWYSLTNQPIAGAVSLEPRLGDAAEDALIAGRVNALAQQPAAFISLGELTLSPDPDYGEVHVRRLMILLRRLALREGTPLVFQPHDAALRRQAERLFEALLGDMYVRGAFAGASPDEAFQVLADARLNTPQTMDQGQLIIELQVAPSSPMNFLTIRLVQQGGDLLTAQEGE